MDVLQILTYSNATEFRTSLASGRYVTLRMTSLDPLRRGRWVLSLDWKAAIDRLPDAKIKDDAPTV